MVIWFIIPATRSQHANHNNNALALIVLIQYIPRLYLIFPLSSQIIKATGVVTKTAWAGAAYNLLLYMLASHVCSSNNLISKIDALKVWLIVVLNTYDRHKVLVENLRVYAWVLLLFISVFFSFLGVDITTEYAFLSFSSGYRGCMVFAVN